jgi:hypothetical protein
VALGTEQAAVELVAGVLPGAALLAAVWGGVRPSGTHQRASFHHFVK